ncbi:AAA family ATPase [Myxococcus hansupus]|nr:AAA family ATPase [Myxococcus hansupus]
MPLHALSQAVKGFFGYTSPVSTEPEDTPGGALFESGDVLIRRIIDAIRLRRPVLVTGPRGSGKSHCAREAIERCVDEGVIGGYHFVQGNREIGRDYLSEDSLTIRRERQNDPSSRPVAQVIDALLVRGTGDSERISKRRGKNEHFPGIPDGGALEWEASDWTVLFLDEINRFGDGVLDSLLSLTEERVIVRGGVKLHVPIIVVATANPPGYDATAKKLSPPLQARIARAYRVSQPTLETLSLTILPAQIQNYIALNRSSREGSNSATVSPDLTKLIAAASLCLWGAPSLSRKGVGFLTYATRQLLKEAMKADPVLSGAMVRLGELTSFGPDARSVGDWVGSAMGRALDREEDRLGATAQAAVAAPGVTHTDLIDASNEALASKVRENFNEGAEPLKAAEKETLVEQVVSRVLRQPAVRAVFLYPVESAALRLLALPPVVLDRPVEEVFGVLLLRDEPTPFNEGPVALELRKLVHGYLDKLPAEKSPQEITPGPCEVLRRTVKLLRSLLVESCIELGRMRDRDLIQRLASDVALGEGQPVIGQLRILERLSDELKTAARREQRWVLKQVGSYDQEEAVLQAAALFDGLFKVLQARVAEVRAQFAKHQVSLKDHLERAGHLHPALAPWASALSRAYRQQEVTGAVADALTTVLVAAAEALRDFGQAPVPPPLSTLSPLASDLLDRLSGGMGLRRGATQPGANVESELKTRLVVGGHSAMTDEDSSKVHVLAVQAQDVMKAEAVAKAHLEIDRIFAALTKQKA